MRDINNNKRFLAEHLMDVNDCDTNAELDELLYIIPLDNSSENFFMSICDDETTPSIFIYLVDHEEKTVKLVLEYHPEKIGQLQAISEAKNLFYDKIKKMF